MKACTDVFLINDPHSIHSDENDKKALFLRAFLVNNKIKKPYYMLLSLQNEVHIINLESDMNRRLIKELTESISQIEPDDKLVDIPKLQQLEAELRELT